MDAMEISAQAAEKSKSADLMKQLEARPEGLAADEVQRRLSQYGANEITEKTHSAVIKFLSYLWGPIPWMIEVAAILSFIVRHWVDLIIIVLLLLFNAVVGFWQEYQAGNAVAALKKKLADRKSVV